MSYWIIKSDPESYDWEQMKKDKVTSWDGVRNYQARNNLRLMKEGDICLFYLSNKVKAIFGEVEIVKESYPDPTTDQDAWVAVDVKYLKDYKKPLTLNEIKKYKKLHDIPLVKQSRLSVMSITIMEYKDLIKLIEA